MSTAVACSMGFPCTMYCWMEDPSLEAKYLSSERKNKYPRATKIFGSFFGVAAAPRISSSFWSRGTEKGSFSKADVQRSVYDLVGANCTGLACKAEFALATTNASRVMRAISDAVTRGEAANPHWPAAITRTPNPKLC